MEASFLKPEPSLNASASREKKREPGRVLEPGGGCSHATELFNPTFLHYIGIPYVHSHFLLLMLTLACPSGECWLEACFLAQDGKTKNILGFEGS